MASHPHDPLDLLSVINAEASILPTVGVNALGAVRGDLTRGIAEEDCININNKYADFRDIKLKSVSFMSERNL